MTFTFKTREEYLVYKADWKARYFAVSQQIRDLRATRKAACIAFSRLDYNDPGYWSAYTEMNSSWGPLSNARALANRLLEERKDSKEEAGIQRAARLQEAA